MKLIADMIASALRTSWRMLMVIVFLVSIAFNASTAALGLSSSVVASVIEVVTGVPQVGSVRSKEIEVSKLKGRVAGLSWSLQKAKDKAARLTAALATQQKAVVTVSRRVKARTAKAASADMGAKNFQLF